MVGVVTVCEMHMKVITFVTLLQNVLSLKENYTVSSTYNTLCKG